MLPHPPTKLSLASVPTEFRLLRRFSSKLGGPRIWLKCDDQTGSLVSGNKIRKLEYLMADAIAQECEVVITCGGLQSNHCRATAAIAARLGLSCHLILRGPKGQGTAESVLSQQDLKMTDCEGNLLLDILCGASVSVYAPEGYQRRLNEILVEHEEYYRNKGKKAYVIPTGGSNALGLWGYISAAEELNEDFRSSEINPGAIVCATGSGGTQGGLTLGFHLLGSTTPVYGVAVCDSAQYFKDKILDDVGHWQKRFAPDRSELGRHLNISTIEGYIGPGYAQGYPELFTCIKELAQLEGVVLDPVYTGKAFYGLVQEVKEGRFNGVDDIVFVHTGGIYGLFPYRSHFE